MAILLALLLLSVPAFAGSQVALVYDAVTLDLRMIVVPDDDKELDDPAYTPKGTAQMRVPIGTFATSTPAKLQAAVPGWKPPIAIDPVEVKP